MEALQIIVPFAGIIIGGFIGYFLKQALYERQRRDELADRDFNRRVALHDMRIKEARDYVDTYSSWIDLVQVYTGVLSSEKSLDRANETILGLKNDYSDLHLQMKEAFNKGTTFEILNDKELTELRNSLQLTVKVLTDKFTKIMIKVNKGEELDFTELEALPEIVSKADKIIVKMKARLDKLAQTVP